MSVAAEKKTIKLDIACGASKKPGYVGLDVANLPGVDHVCDLNRFPWPIESDSVTEAWCSHYLEHIAHIEPPDMLSTHVGGSAWLRAPDRWTRSVEKWGHVRDLFFDFWEEVYRVLVHGGTIQVVTPYYSSRRADQDPTHARRICEESYLYLSQDWLRAMKVAYPYEADFCVVKAQYLRYGREVEDDKVAKELNAVDDFAVLLQAKKPARCWWKE